MEAYLEDFKVDGKNPSVEAQRRWREAVSLVKNPRRRFRMVADLAKRDLAQKKRRSVQLSGQLLTAYGYGAPETIESGSYTAQSDVFSFGVVMLELLTGRKSYDRNRNRGEQSLARWAIPQLHDIDKLSKMVDSSLNGKISAKSLSNFADIISRCVQVEPEFRPPMSEVVQDLTDMIRRDRPSNESIGD